MDPTVLTGILSALIGGAAGELGKGAWASLTTLARRRFGRESAAVTALEQADSDKPDEIAGLLVDLAAIDPEFGKELHRWTTEAAHIIQQRRDVSNTISGEAQITGPVIQAGDIHGSVSFDRA
ncbi:hypothetical protein AB0O34_17950 [Sphaerisporangium sp. NPDC088356]|uniref:hypothetical protein n=1 Tax=Sphaerisporangium sp. NPDC088356 TaxID=3154871 RepID=UPI00342AA7D5